VTVVDVVSKKIMFLRHLCRVLNFQDVTCVASRVEQLSPCHPSSSLEGCFDIIVSRAVGTIPHLLHLAAPFFAPGGHVLLQRGHKAPQEIHEHDAFFREAGFQIANIVPVKLSFFVNPRYLVLLSYLI
jgi:16S rRNA (guanine527-N7)-methyltransferase